MRSPTALAVTVAVISTTTRLQPCRVVRSLPACACAEVNCGDEVVRQTQEWIEGHVIRLGLCPFAAKPFVQDNIRYVVTDAVNDEELIDDFYVEASHLLIETEEALATTFLITPHYAAGIEDFTILYEWLVDNLESSTEALDDGVTTGDLRTPIEEIVGNRVQPAFFHPQWTFHGMPASSPVHFEKRAPYPVINLLRRATLDHGE